MPEPKKNTAFAFDVSLVSQATRPAFQSSPTLAAGDVKVTGADGAAVPGALANIATLPDVSPAAGTNVRVQLSAAEMNFDRVIVQFSDAAGAEWDPVAVELITSANTTDDIYTRLGAPAAASVSADIAAVQADLPQRITKNVALSAFMFFMVDSTDHVSAKTGLTITATRSLDGAAFAACANAAAEVSNGWYKIDLAAADLNANVVALKFTSTGADARNITIITEPT